MFDIRGMWRLPILYVGFVDPSNGDFRSTDMLHADNMGGIEKGSVTSTLHTGKKQ